MDTVDDYHGRPTVPGHLHTALESAWSIDCWGLLASTDPLTVVVQAPAPGPPLCLLLK